MNKALAGSIAGAIIGASAFLGSPTFAQADTFNGCQKYVFKTIYVGNPIKVVRIVFIDKNCVPTKPVPGPVNPSPNTAVNTKLAICGAVKVGEFFKIIECNPNA